MDCRILGDEDTSCELCLTFYQPWLRLNCSLGEGAFWEEKTNTVRFVDIETQSLHRVDISAGPTSHKVVKEHDVSIR